MSEPIRTRTLQFFEKMELGNPIKGICSVCKKLFIAESKSEDRMDEVLLRMRNDFDAHDCHEETREITARIVRGS